MRLRLRQVSFTVLAGLCLAPLTGAALVLHHSSNYVGHAADGFLALGLVAHGHAHETVVPRHDHGYRLTRTLESASKRRPLVPATCPAPRGPVAVVTEAGATEPLGILTRGSPPTLPSCLSSCPLRM